jgi:predicted negative regulator of RcsB-dependent stress response
LADKKIGRKELLKEPDEFISTSGQVVNYIRENPRVIAAACGAFILTVLAVYGYMNYTQYQFAKSQDLFQSAHRDYENLAYAQDAAPEALEKLAEKFSRIVTDYGSSSAGELALLYNGHVLFQKGDHRKALEKYEAMQSTALVVKKGLAPLVAYHIAMTRLALKEYDQARGLLDRFVKDTRSPYHREAHASIARIYESEGKFKEAVNAYDDYLKKFPDAPDAMFIKSRIAALAAKT